MKMDRTSMVALVGGALASASLVLAGPAIASQASDNGCPCAAASQPATAPSAGRPITAPVAARPVAAAPVAARPATAAPAAKAKRVGTNELPIAPVGP